MRTFKVYLAGPISGQSYGGATDWREYAREQLSRGEPVPPYEYYVNGEGITHMYSGIEAYSPMRAKGYLEEMDEMPEYLESKPLSTMSAILNRDHWDCQTSDAILVNLLDAQKISIGTVMEIAWGYAYRRPTVLIAKEEDAHRHGMIVESVGWHTTNLDEGIQMIKDILLP